MMPPPPQGGGNRVEEEDARDIKEFVGVCARTLPSHVFQSERALDAMPGACGLLDGHRPRVGDENSLQPRGETEEARRVWEKLNPGIQP